MLLVLEARQLDRMHPSDLERLQAVAEANVRQVRAALKRRQKLLSRRKPLVGKVAPAPLTSASGHAPAQDGRAHGGGGGGGGSGLVGGRVRLSSRQDSRPPSAAIPLASACGHGGPSSERPVSVGPASRAWVGRGLVG